MPLGLTKSQEQSNSVKLPSPRESANEIEVRGDLGGIEIERQGLEELGEELPLPMFMPMGFCWPD